ncbi:hypothetical protein MSAN_02266100 [Mycena sanguinolenta]|uniref:Uncharacterized protein n=1 Tax=Mycena sanguinolenta TaxID=230812 RepID=A0A8H6XA03_9AGAR|nr:hypothetical protein MSAN_02266100 [Mycena sanguinolenta]
MHLLPFLSVILLTASISSAQGACGDVAGTIASQVAEMNAFNNKTPPPSVPTDCIKAKGLKKGIDDYRTGEIEDPGDGCTGLYANAIRTNTAFNPAYSKLAKFVAMCP